MSTEVGGGSRTLKSINSLITATLVCVVLGALAVGRGLPARASTFSMPWPACSRLPPLVPLFLMFGRVRAVEADIGHREALSLAQRKETERNQQAILRLLDELAPLADGDLTVQATVTEDITGTIADSINYAIGVLRDLVSTINQSAIQLDGATRQTQALSAHLAKASSAQSKQIAGATESASNMASSTEAISGNSERASDVARHSVDVAHKGGDAVRRTIDGMNAHSRDDSGDQQAHQAPGRELAGNRQHRRAHQRHRRADQHSRVERLHPGLDGRRCRPRLRGGRRRSAAPRRARRRRHTPDRNAGARHSGRYQRSRGFHGAQHHRRGGRSVARRERRRGARRDRAGLQPDREPREQHLLAARASR